MFPAGYLSGDPLLGNFTSRAIDDSEWWGLTWIQAYDLTKNRKYLDMAVTIAEYVEGYWDEHVRRRCLVGRGADVQERRHQRTLDPAHGRAAQPAAW